MLIRYQTNRLGVCGGVFVAAIAAFPLVVALNAGAQTVTNSSTTTTQDRGLDTASAAMLYGRVTNEAGDYLEGARVLVVIPATDMRFVDSSTNHNKLEAMTDATGKYRLKLPAITRRTTASIDVTKPGYRKLVGTLMSGGDVKEVEVTPGAAVEASFVLKSSLYLKGVVVDEQGKPVPAVKIAANAQYARASGGVERTASNPDGSFELFNYSVIPFAQGDDVAKGVVYFSHPDYVSAVIEDVYTLSPDQREVLRILLPSGRKVAGTVFDIAGKPVSNVMVEAFRGDGGHRKTTMTDANGKFDLRGLAGGRTTLRAHAMELKQKVKLSVDLESDKNDLKIRLQPVSLPAQPKTVAVLGMQLTDVTPELQAAYDLHNPQGALISHPGKESERLNIGQLAEGYTFWMVGYQRVASVREFINQILTEAATQDTDEYLIRVVYTFKNLDSVGTNTQYLKLTKDDLEQLRGALAEAADHK